MKTQVHTAQAPRTAREADERGIILDGCSEYDEKFIDENSVVRTGEYHLEGGLVIPFTQHIEFGKPRWEGK